MNREPFQRDTHVPRQVPSQSSLEFITGYLDMIRQHQDLLVDNVNYMVSSIQHIMTCIRSQQRVMDHLSNIIRSENEMNGSQRFRERTQQTSDLVSNSMYRNRSLNRINRRNSQRHTTRDINDILNSIDLTPVLITPTQQQIDNAIETVQYELSQEQQMDPIDLIPFVPNESIVRIRHCGHCFRRSNLLEWFRRNVRCPLCRYDIREYLHSQSPSQSPSQSHTSISSDISSVNSNNLSTSSSRQSNFNHRNLYNADTNHINNQLRSSYQSPLYNRYRRLQQPSSNTSTNENRESQYNSEVATAYIYLNNLYPDLSLNYTDVEYLINDMNADNYIL